MIYVVMSNDYPAAVFDDEDKAEAFCDAKNADQRDNATHHGVSWRVYSFDVNDTTGADSFHSNYMQMNRKRTA